jgi:hypothetical protein
MHPKMISHAAVLKMNKKLFENCLADVDEQTGQRRPNERTNNMIFLAVHIVDARYFLARMLGAEATWSVSKSLEGVERVEDLEEYPSMEEIRTAWQKVSHLLAERFSKITEKDLERKSPTRVVPYRSAGVHAEILRPAGHAVYLARQGVPTPEANRRAARRSRSCDSRD